MKEISAEEVLGEVMSCIRSLPCSSGDFLGTELDRKVQIVLYGSYDEDEDWEEDEEE